MRGVKWSVLVGLWLFTSLLAGCGGQSAEPAIVTTPLQIDMIIKQKDSEYWNTVKLGAEVAAKEFNVKLNFRGPDRETDIEGQIKLMEASIQAGPDAIILAAGDYMALAKITDQAIGIPVITMDAEVASARPVAFIGANNYASGQLAAERLSTLTGPEAEIGIVNFVKGARNADQRLEGLLDYLARYPGISIMETAYCGADQELAYRQAAAMLEKHPGLDAIVALSGEGGLGVGRAVREAGLVPKVKIVTFDSPPAVMEMLQEGTVQATVIQNPFSNGYLAVKQAVEYIQGLEVPDRTDTGTKLIDLNNMMWPENQKQLFPFVR
ncbi:substrate-binding domain-containing protein [Paenibacillus sp. P96]|uniref:Substrate-binding domain-containing protein n=1 Tax=Paenibacillus zeirhizosphaerae TaxID=2987519 RepID=A0ABT9FPC0_9BACL|nr:substrate-binding domain-containing protein [Paenibacillus sp. P96]MDP4096571.1 substrate-binding domain-containing protein [Paenibacillus sp. P96]